MNDHLENCEFKEGNDCTRCKVLVIEIKNL